jgi:hypothetical protein
LVNGFIDHLYTRLRTAINCSVTANLHNSQITTAHAKLFPTCCIFTSCSLAAASNSGDSSVSRAQVPSSETSVQNRRLKSKLLYDWRFTANQFVLASIPWKTTTTDFFQLNLCGKSPYVTSSLTRRWVYLLWIYLAVRQVYISHI